MICRPYIHKSTLIYYLYRYHSNIHSTEEPVLARVEFSQAKCHSLYVNVRKPRDLKLYQRNKFNHSPGHVEGRWCRSRSFVSIPIDAVIDPYRRHIASWNLDNIGTDNGLLPGGTKPLPEPVLTYPQSSPVAFIWGLFHNRCFSYQTLNRIWKTRTWNYIHILGPFSQWHWLWVQTRRLILAVRLRYVAVYGSIYFPHCDYCLNYDLGRPLLTYIR